MTEVKRPANSEPEDDEDEDNREWQVIDTPSSRVTYVNFERRLEIRVQSIGAGRYSVALLRCARYGPGPATEPIDVYATVVRGMEAVAERVQWLKRNVEYLLAGEDRIENERPEPATRDREVEPADD